MKIIISKEQIIDGLLKAANVIPTKSGTAYLRSIWIKTDVNKIKIFSTDANIEFIGCYPAQVEEGGIIGVQGRAFVDLIKQLPAGKISLHSDPENKVLILEQGKRKYKLPTNDEVWFQNFSEFPKENSIIWSGDFLLELIDKIAFCISDDDSNEAISCFYMNSIGEGRIEACGLNGHQFAMYSFINDDLANLLPEKGLLIQKKYLLELKKWLSNDEIELNISEKRLFFQTSNAENKEYFSIPRTDYVYPDYNSFMSKLNADNVSLLKVSRKDCIEALSRISIFNTEIDRCTYFKLTDNEAVLSAQGQDIGSANEVLEVDFKLSDISQIAFPTRKLMDLMSHFLSDTLTMTLSGTEGPCGIKGVDDTEYFAIIMPMKIAKNSYYSEDDV